MNRNRGIIMRPFYAVNDRVLGLKDTLSKYYSRTEIQIVFVDAMILNPHTKLVIAEEESWSDVNAD
jgi:hypothetical protein